jgi:Tfp pilus assembly protein PilF
LDLIDVADGSQIWGQRYSRKRTELLGLQDELGDSIVDTLRVRLARASPRLTAIKHSTENVDAYQAYLRGRYLCDTRFESQLHKGIEHLERAVQLDPSYALAYAGIAECYNHLAGYYSSPRYYPEAKSAARKALDLDDTLAEPHASLGLSFLFYDWDWSSAEKEFRQALQLNSKYAQAHDWYGILLWVTDRLQESRSEIKRARELDPLSYIINLHAGRVLYYSRDYDGAIKQLKDTLELYPSSTIAKLELVKALEQKHLFAEAKGLLGSLNPPDPRLVSEIDEAYAYFYALSGERAEAQIILQRLKAEPKGTDSYFPIAFAQIYSALNEADQAFEWIEKAYDEHLDWLVHIKVEPRFDPIRADPRFTSVLRRMKLSP